MGESVGGADMGKIKILLGASILLIVSGQVNAAIITLNFQGVIDTYTDFSPNPSSFGVGTKFTGWVKYNADNADFIDIFDTNPGNNYAVAFSDSGCDAHINGECIGFKGDDKPVVIDYRFNWVGENLKPWKESLDFADVSIRINNFDVPPAPVPQEKWSVGRSQYDINTTGDIDNYAYTSTSAWTQFDLQAFSSDGAFLLGEIDDFDQLFDTDLLFSNGGSFIQVSSYESTEKCNGADNCVIEYEEGSYKVVGTLTRAKFKVSPVPEPTAIWLFGTGLIGLIGFTKRRKQLSL